MTQEQSIEVLGTAKRLADQFKSRSDEIEKARTLPGDIVNHLKASGLLRLCVPKEYGGAEVTAEAFVRALDIMGRADASVSWCMMIAGTSELSAAYLKPAVAQKIYGENPQAISSGVFAPKGKAIAKDGMLTVNGQWQWGSGSQHSDWVMGGCMVFRDGELDRLPNGAPMSRMVIVPRAEVEFLDTWHVSGLCGTGSTDYTLSDVRVPEDYSVSIVADRPQVDGSLYKFPIFGLLAAGIAGVALGIGRRAIDELTALAAGKTPQGASRPLALRSATQLDVARAEAKLESARSYLYGVIQRAWDNAQHADSLTVEDRRDLRLAATHATITAAEVTDLMYNLGGGTSVFKTSALQRCFRDVHVATQHMMVSPSVLELTGRLFLDVETDVTML